jgi:ribosomal protein L18E
MGPINYSLQGIQTPFQSLAGGFQIGSQMAQAQAMRQEAEARAAQQQQALLQQQAAAEQQRMLSEQLMALRNKPNPTARDYENLAMFLPKDRSEAMLNWFKTRSTEEQGNLLAFNGQVLSAAETKPEVAVNLLRERATAERNKGNEADAKGFELQANLIEQDPKMARVTLAPMIARLPGGKELLEGVNKALEERRAAALQPLVEQAERRKGMPSSILEAIEFENLTPSQQQTFRNTQSLRQPVTKIEVSNIDRTASAELGKMVPNLAEQANAAVNQVSDLGRYRQALQSAIVGPGAEQRLVVARVASALGFTGDKAVNATTELIQGNAEMALNARSLLRGQGEITQGEQKLLIQAKAGDINFTKGELETLFNVFERSARAQYARNTKLLEATIKTGKAPTAELFLGTVQPMPEAAAPATQATAGDVRSRADQIIRGGR